MGKIEKSDSEWRQQLDDEQYRVTREKGTETPFSGQYLDLKAAGTYHCVCCNEPLFESSSKFNSGTGWPSFTRPLSTHAVAEESDTSHGIQRTEVHCARCNAHLGHVFADGPGPAGLRYCINSVSLHFEPEVP